MDLINREDIRQKLVTSKEVLEILGIKRSRLSQLVKSGKLQPMKKNIYLLSDILERKSAQVELRKKFYRPKGNVSITDGDLNYVYTSEKNIK